MTLTWNGFAIMREVEVASMEAINETTAACVPLGQDLVHVRTGLLQSRIGTVPAEVRGDEVVGAYGVTDDPGYAREQEYLPEPRGRAYVRPPADQEYPRLGDRIAKRLA